MRGMKGGKVVKHVRPKWFLSLLFGALSLAALILLLLCLPAVQASGRVPMYFYGSIMAGVAYSAFWHIHDLFARRPFAVYEIERKRMEWGVAHIVRLGKSMAPPLVLIMAVGLIFAAQWMHAAIAAKEGLFAFFGAGFFALFLAVCIYLLRTCVGKKRGALYVVREDDWKDEAPAWEDGAPARVNAEVRPGRPWVVLRAGLAALGFAALAAVACVFIARGAPWYAIAAVLGGWAFWTYCSWDLVRAGAEELAGKRRRR